MSAPNMEPSNTPAPNDCAVLSRSTLATLRRVLNAFRDGWVLEGRLGAVARMTADDARQRGLSAERMIVSLKGDWARLEEVRRLPPLDARDLLSRLVSLSIRAYYDAGGRASPARGEIRRAGRESVA